MGWRRFILFCRHRQFLCVWLRSRWERQDRADETGSHTALHGVLERAAVDFPARPVRVPCLLRATEEGAVSDGQNQVAMGNETEFVRHASR